MAVIIFSKQGTPLKISNTFLINPKVSPRKTAVFRKLPLPENRAGLSRPEGPTTTNFNQANADIPARHAYLYSRIPDRGGSRPFAGMNVTLPNGKIGGTNNRITPTLLSISRQTKTIIPGNRYIADKFQNTLRKTAFKVQKAENRKGWARLMPGFGGLDYAQAPKSYIQPQTGKWKTRGTVPPLKPKGWGIFSQHRTAPWDKVNDLALISGQKRWSLIGAQSKMGWGTKNKAENPDIKIGEKNPSAMAMQTSAPRTEQGIATEQGGLNWVFLLSVAVLGYFAIRKG